MKRDPLYRWKKLAKGATQVRGHDLQSAREYLSKILAEFRKPDDTERDPEGYAVHRMAVALARALTDGTSFDPLELDELPMVAFDINPTAIEFADDEVCPMCGNPKKAKG